MKPGPAPKFVDPEKIVDFLIKSRRPRGIALIYQYALGATSARPSRGVVDALINLEAEGRIKRIPWKNGFGYISLEKHKMLRQYKVLADIDKHNKDYTIETDERNQALKIATTFSKNWKNVRIEFAGVTYPFPFGNLEKLP